ncbi:MAG: Tad domain-containing protein [Amylibacter sp.]
MLASLFNKFTSVGFKRDKNGSIIVFVMVVFSIMMMIGGAGVVLARYEFSRSTLQYNLDRAVLAAASLKQQQYPRQL